jgi:hypothetical protein
MTKHVLAAVVICLLAGHSCPGGEAADDPLNAKPEAVEAWKDLRFGMFLCWGPVSLTGHEIAIAALGSLARVAGDLRADEKPVNVVFILADDLGWTDLGCYGSTFHKTPHLDALARRGMLFNQAYVPNPLCAPARSSIMTGLNPARTGMTYPDIGHQTIRLEKGLRKQAVFLGSLPGVRPCFRFCSIANPPDVVPTVVFRESDSVADSDRLDAGQSAAGAFAAFQAGERRDNRTASAIARDWTVRCLRCKISAFLEEVSIPTIDT